MTYALLVRDIASGIDRTKIDDALAGFTSPDTADPGSMPEPSIEELRETWGRTPTAIQSKQALDAMMGRIDKDGRIIGTGSG